VIDIKNVSKWYGSFQVLADCSTEVGKGEVVVVCGRNRETYNDVVHWRAEHPQLGCFVDGFSEEMHLLMQASDAIVTRGGTTTDGRFTLLAAECLASCGTAPCMLLDGERHENLDEKQVARLLESAR